MKRKEPTDDNNFEAQSAKKSYHLITSIITTINQINPWKLQNVFNFLTSNIY
jgi:hypothetical protein